MNPDLYCASVTYKSNTYDKPIFNLVKFLAWTEIYDFVVLPPQRELGFIRVLALMNPDLYCASVTYKSNTYDKPIFNLVKFLAWTEIYDFVVLPPQRELGFIRALNLMKSDNYCVIDVYKSNTYDKCALS
ncbi:hypothetical protein CEP67_06060 [Staphylococcus pettenkoferi]|nr:hypothetical protein CEP67_06060 [Staphylococcus pettenkoferi]